VPRWHPQKRVPIGTIRGVVFWTRIWHPKWCQMAPSLLTVCSWMNESTTNSHNAERHTSFQRRANAAVGIGRTGKLKQNQVSTRQRKVPDFFWDSRVSCPGSCRPGHGKGTNTTSPSEQPADYWAMTGDYDMLIVCWPRSHNVSVVCTAWRQSMYLEQR